jgi:predicted ribosomally synthesized peptide with SipW-like signal peptide
MKKKIIVTALVVCIFVLSIASATVAYFTDTQSATNTFTVGNVDIQITEALVEVESGNANGTENIVKVNPEARQINTDLDYRTIRNLYPGQTIAKDPTIENVGSENAYVAAKITISGLNGLITGDNVEEFLTNGAINTAGNYIAYKLDGGTFTIYFIAKDALTAQSGKVMLFDTVNIPATWGNAQMEECSDLVIQVEAFATQKAGFADAMTAIQTAFATEFGSVVFNEIA